MVNVTCMWPVGSLAFAEPWGYQKEWPREAVGPVREQSRCILVSPVVWAGKT